MILVYACAPGSGLKMKKDGLLEYHRSHFVLTV